jgi:hypothetical protein
MSIATLAKDIARPIYYGLLKSRIALGVRMSKIKDAKSIPIIINNRNRVTALRQLIDSLTTRGYYNLHIIDNDSTYPPLLSFYETCPHKIHRLGYNGGYLALWHSGLIRQFGGDFFVYTDADVVPIAECPEDFMALWLAELKQNSRVFKIGFSLKIDDLPAHYSHRQKVIDWEQQFYQQPVTASYYDALIDTTFALYKPGMLGGALVRLPAYRSAPPCQARHLPWYVDSAQPDEEERYYIEHAQTTTHWTSQGH